jgi:hypothetical protein
MIASELFLLLFFLGLLFPPEPAHPRRRLASVREKWFGNKTPERRCLFLPKV